MSTTRLVAIPLFDRNSPSLRPDLGCLTYGWERRSSMAVRPPRQRRGACLRAVPSHATLAGRRARFHFRFPPALQRTGSGSGKPIKNCAHRAIKGRDPAHTATVGASPQDSCVQGRCALSRCTSLKRLGFSGTPPFGECLVTASTRFFRAVNQRLTNTCV